MKTAGRKLEKFRRTYGALLVSYPCFYTFVHTWGEGGLFLPWFFLAGGVICGLFGFFDLRRAIPGR